MWRDWPWLRKGDSNRRLEVLEFVLISASLIPMLVHGPGAGTLRILWHGINLVHIDCQFSIVEHITSGMANGIAGCMA